MVENLIEEITKKERKSVVRFFRKFPTWLKIILFVGWTIFSLVGGYQLKSLNIDLNIIKQFSHQDGKNNINISAVKGTTTINVDSQNDCIYKICSDFKDGKWEFLDRFIQVQPDPLILKSPNTPALPGATMFYDEDVKNFTAQIFITPLASVSASIVLAYGHFYRCILGDSDYKLITCQINQAYPTIPENWSYFDEEGTTHDKNKRYQILPFEQNKELQIKFEQKEISNNTTITIKINNQVPAEWILPKDYKGRTLKEKIGVGLISTSYGDSQAIFKSFELSPQL